MNRSLTMMRMIMARRMTSWGIAPFFFTAMVVLMLALRALQEITGAPLDLSLSSNGCIAGLLLASSISALTACFPLATAVGISRRDIVLGNLLYNLQAVAYTTLCFSGLLMLEQITGGWFLGLRTFDSTLLAPQPALWWFSPLLFLMMTVLGASLAAAWLWKGRFGLLIHAAIIAAVIVTMVWFALSHWQQLSPWLPDSALLGGTMGLITIVSFTETTVFIHRASVRGS